MPAPLKRAYVWTREHSPQRLRMLGDVSATWSDLFGEPRRLGHYAGIQWAGERWRIRNYRGPNNCQGFVDGRRVTVHPRVIPARSWYARELYLRALARTRARYPDFDAHRFVDGDRVGERRIEFLNERHSLSKSHLSTALWMVAKDASPVVHEACLLEPCDAWGSAAAATSTFERAPHPDHVRATLILDVVESSVPDLTGIVDDLKEGRLPRLSPDPLHFSFDDIKDGLVELSDPELVVLNWEDALPAPTEADDALWKAAYALDADRIERAIADGADVNASRDDYNCLLARVIEGWQDHRFLCEASDEDLARQKRTRPVAEISRDQMLAILRRLLDAGAHPDLHSPEQTPAIVDAALAGEPAVAALLLDYGADGSIAAFWDGAPGTWPAAWDYAYTDGFNLEQDAGAREVYYELMRRGSSPLYEQADEDNDRRDAWLPPEQRKWQPDSE
jgi:hypothetical protein